MAGALGGCPSTLPPFLVPRLAPLSWQLPCGLGRRHRCRVIERGREFRDERFEVSAIRELCVCF